ncbi:RagB/SusD family nutrient uptake outer membrane protein [Sphingobacterium sp. E70]|nr:RagB/SusD family nutrient uptake outer membrane protein [Sphingobacterium sp. E70]ULT23687.1 RagB/SusD family nutrient uptake outer membrane protein [Sphingobacterium sp. E70]
MKIKQIGFMAIATIAMLSSCSSDLLDKNPTTAISGETFWMTDADARMALTGVYRRLQAGFFYGQGKLWLDTYSDNALDRHSYYGFGDLTQGIVNSTNVSDAFYNTPYAGISGCNFFWTISTRPRAPKHRKLYTKRKHDLYGLFSILISYRPLVLWYFIKLNRKPLTRAKSPKAQKKKSWHSFTASWTM